MDVDQAARSNAQEYFGVKDPDYYEFEGAFTFIDHLILQFKSIKYFLQETIFFLLLIFSTRIYWWWHGRKQKSRQTMQQICKTTGRCDRTGSNVSRNDFYKIICNYKDTT